MAKHHFTIISGPTELFLVAPQHNEHCKGWRWEMYMADQRKRCAAMRDEALKIIARRRADEDTEVTLREIA